MLSHLKKRLGVLTAIAVLAALVPALTASPASAAPSATLQAMADNADLSACPASASIPSSCREAIAPSWPGQGAWPTSCMKWWGANFVRRDRGPAGLPRCA